jgi:hypothetical protein
VGLDSMVPWRVLDKTTRLVAVRLYGDESLSTLGLLLDDPQWWRALHSNSPRKCRRSVKRNPDASQDDVLERD